MNKELELIKTESGEFIVIDNLPFNQNMPKGTIYYDGEGKTRVWGTGNCFSTLSRNIVDIKLNHDNCRQVWEEFTGEIDVRKLADESWNDGKNNFAVGTDNLSYTNGFVDGFYKYIELKEPSNKWIKIDYNNPPKGEVLLLTTSKVIAKGDYWKNQCGESGFRTEQSRWGLWGTNEKECLSVLKPDEIIAYQHLPPSDFTAAIELNKEKRFNKAHLMVLAESVMNNQKDYVMNNEKFIDDFINFCQQPPRCLVEIEMEENGCTLIKLASKITQAIE